MTSSTGFQWVFRIWLLGSWFGFMAGASAMLKHLLGEWGNELAYLVSAAWLPITMVLLHFISQDSIEDGRQAERERAHDEARITSKGHG